MHKSFMMQLAKGRTECVICYLPYPFGECHKALKAGYIIEYNPAKAQAKYDALNIENNREDKKKLGKHIKLAH